MITTNSPSSSDFVNMEYENVKTDLIHITDDKLKNIMNDYISNLKKTLDWLTPFSLSLTLLITFLTTEFSKDFLGISKSFWSYIFITAFIGSLVGLIASLTNCCLLRKTTKLDYLIDRIKNKN